MNERLTAFVRACSDICDRYGADPQTASALLNALYGPALKAYGIATIVVSAPQQVTLAVTGQLSGESRTNAGVVLQPQTIDVRLDELTGQDGIQAAAQALERGLAQYVLAGDGAYVWIVPDGYMAALTDAEQRRVREGAGYFSHEALCVQNTGPHSTRCELSVYFEAPGHEVLRYEFDVPAQRSIHLRLDKIPGLNGRPFIPNDAPVGYKLVSKQAPVIVQGSRILTSGRDSEFASFGTTMAWTPA